MPCGGFLASTNRRRFCKNTRMEEETYYDLHDLHDLHDLVSRCERYDRESKHRDM